jgi:hypothetical protein
MKLLLNVFGYVTGREYDTHNTANTVSSSLMPHVIIFIAFLKMYCVAFFHRNSFVKQFQRP